MWNLVLITTFLGLVTSVFSNSTELLKKVDVIRSNAAPFYFSTPKETPSFSCEDRPSGYYADPRYQCQVFHLCRSDGTQSTIKCQERHDGICLLKTITARACQGGEIHLPEDIYFKDTTTGSATEYRLGEPLPQPTEAPKSTTPLFKGHDALIDIAPDRKKAYLVEVYNNDGDYSAYRRKAKKLFFGGKKVPGKHPRRKRSVEMRQRGRPYAIVYAKVPDTTAASAGDPVPSERQDGLAFTYGQGIVQGNGGSGPLVPITIETRRKKNRPRKKEQEQTSEQRNIFYYSPDGRPSGPQNQPQPERPLQQLPNFPFQPPQSPRQPAYYYDPGYHPQGYPQPPVRASPPAERPRPPQQQQQQQQPPGFSGYPFFQNFPGFDEFRSPFSQRDPRPPHLRQQVPVQERPQEAPVEVQPGRDPSSPYEQRLPQQERPRQPPPEAPQRPSRPRGRPDEHVPVIIQEIPRPSRRPSPQNIPQRPPQHNPYQPPPFLYQPQYPPGVNLVHQEVPQVERPQSDPRPVVLMEDYRGEPPTVGPHVVEEFPTRPHVVEETPTRPHVEEEAERFVDERLRNQPVPHVVEEVMVREPVGRPRYRPESVPSRPHQIEEVLRQPAPERTREERQRQVHSTRHQQPVEEVVRTPVSERGRQRARRPEHERTRAPSQYFSPTPASPSRPSRVRQPDREVRPQEEFGSRRPEERPRSRPVQEGPVDHRFFERPQPQRSPQRVQTPRPTRPPSSTPERSRDRVPQPQIERPPSEYVVAEPVPEVHRGHNTYQGNEVDRPRTSPNVRQQHHRNPYPEIEGGFIPMTEVTPVSEYSPHRDRTSSQHEGEYHSERSRPVSQPAHEAHQDISHRPSHEEERRPVVSNRYPEVDEVQTTKKPTPTRKPPPKPTFPTFPTFPPPPKRPVTSPRPPPEHLEADEEKTSDLYSTLTVRNPQIDENDERISSTTPPELSTRKRTRKRKQRPRRPRPTEAAFPDEGELVTQPTTARDVVVTPSSRPRSQSSARWQKSTPNPRKSTTTTTPDSSPSEFGSRINLFGRQRSRRPTATTTQPPATTVRTRKAFAKRVRARPTTTETPDTDSPIARSDENTELLVYEGFEPSTDSPTESTTEFFYPINTESYNEMVDTTTTELISTTDEQPQEDFESTRSISKKFQNRPRVLKFGKPKLRTTLSPIDLNAAESRFG